MTPANGHSVRSTQLCAHFIRYLNQKKLHRLTSWKQVQREFRGKQFERLLVNIIICRWNLLFNWTKRQRWYKMKANTCVRLVGYIGVNLVAIPELTQIRVYYFRWVLWWNFHVFVGVAGITWHYSKTVNTDLSQYRWMNCQNISCGESPLVIHSWVSSFNSYTNT